MGFLESNEDFGLALGLAENIRNTRAQVRVRDEQIADLERRLAVKTAHAEGLLAQLRAFQATHPNSPLCCDSGRRYGDGDIKTTGRLLYEKAFDACLAGKNMANPQQYRAD